ncbi:MarR family winged helix-turn-helix transcriptional regulator [Cyclobacterium plantarum]|uniref:MarR family transcriptional regulator n=1 Tax=Cyclobacterium plantarum TaxID=2716263 RepID=A0ABX0HDP3_9BACT|nr:MarR family transcriptional regulator [Cyclobacterium plantarum]NHE58622.1 MarR family transcriptional regulator [Cyclobacterium plantarum]
MEFEFESSFGRILGVAHTAMFRHLSKLMKERHLPITPDQFRVLTHLWQQDGLQQTALASCTNRNRANITRIIDILEREGIVERKDDPGDRRVFRIYLTQKGKALKKDTAACAAQSIADSLQGISDSEIETCKKVLLKIRENVG